MLPSQLQGYGSRLLSVRLRPRRAREQEVPLPIPDFSNRSSATDFIEEHTRGSHTYCRLGEASHVTAGDGEHMQCGTGVRMHRCSCSRGVRKLGRNCLRAFSLASFTLVGLRPCGSLRNTAVNKFRETPHASIIQNAIN
ncbi:hypothetical protein BU26DRAFT_51717 [Trematosphaeria pertusa]|uniref:Uncharacterized protein n=1 Tax=Trematosphaeria pertusa TaxID=390896 RepID=A0A6A6I838_9PLEO|nr:uncharacterized protein BU26DRAFT_51717 [Trematosphaeria pertusa]KAF2246714.1 hypothetical protein BU26DRAFT_51717 [Trematosphaeria pertusa]